MQKKVGNTVMELCRHKQSMQQEHEHFSQSPP